MVNKPIDCKRKAPHQGFLEQILYRFWVCVRVGKSKCIWLLSTRIYPSIRLSRPLGDSSLFGKYHHCVIRQKLYFTTGKCRKKETIFTYLRKACEEPHARHKSQPSINSARSRDERASKCQQAHGVWFVVSRAPVCVDWARWTTREERERESGWRRGPEERKDLAEKPFARTSRPLLEQAYIA